MSNEASFGTLAVHRLPLYNPSRLKDAEIITAFAARKQLLERLIADLDAEQPSSRAQHHLVVGQRGMGKTLLLARIAAELRTGPLAARFIPLVFAEEQYAIDRLSKFWLNCLDSLADEQDRAGSQAVVQQIDDTVQQLTSRLSRTKGDDTLAREALAAFLEAAARTGRRPVLLVDNLQIVFERLTSEENHSLREVLMRPDCPILIGASPSPLSESQDYGAAFYDHFKVHYLRPLSQEEMQAVMLHLANAVGRDDVRRRVADHPARLAVLHQLTGGNPRTTVTLFFLYAEDFAPNVFSDLENLLDRVTPLYKAIFEELSPQQQVLASAIANHWDPVTSRQLEESTGLASSKISPQLDRLEKTGFIEKVELFQNASSGYQIAERFFNVWFLMRSASRRQRREIEFLTRFLQVVYEAPDRERLARHLMTEHGFGSDRYLLSQAVADSLPNKQEGEDLKRHAQLDVLRQQDRAARRKLDEVLNFSSWAPATIAFEQLRLKLCSLVPPTSRTSPERFAGAVLSDRKMFQDSQRERLASRSEVLSAKEITAILQEVKISRWTDESIYSEKAVKWFTLRLINGQIRSSQDIEDWDRAFQATDIRENIKLMVETLPTGIGSQLSDEVFQKIRNQLSPTAEATTWDWFSWAYLLNDRLQRYHEAKEAYKMSIAIDGKNVAAWNNLAILLGYKLGRYQEAEEAYQNAIAIDGKSSKVWNNLGILLEEHLQRYEEAEEAYRTSISNNAQNSEVWNNLGEVLGNHLQRYQEAQDAYHKSLDVNARNSRAWTNLGRLLYVYFQNYSDASEALDTAVELAPLDEIPRHDQIWLYRDYLGKALAALPFLEDLIKIIGQAIKEPEILLLQRALFSAYDNNWGIAKKFLTEAFDTIMNIPSQVTTSEWMKASAVLLHLNYGAELLDFLQSRGDNTRLRPWYEAINALQLGDRRYLQNIAPEIRTTAETFYDQIERILNALPDSTRRRPLPESPKPARSRRSKKR